MADVTEILKAAIQSHQAGNLQAAEQFYSQVIEQNPEHPIALHSMAVLAHQTGQNQTAVELVAKAITSNPQIPQFHNTRGLILEAVGNFSEAICSYEKAISLDPNFAQGHLNIAIALQSNGDFAGAVKKCDQIISLYGQSAQVYNLMGYSLEQQKKYLRAIESYRQAIELQPDFAEPYNHISVILNDQGQYDQAVENAKKALEIDRDYVEAYNNLGTALNGIGDYCQAMENYKKAISLNPDFAEAYYNLANCLRNQNQCDHAIEFYKKAIQLNPDYPHAHWNLSHAYLLTGQFSQGWKEYRWRRNRQLGIISYPHHYEQPLWDGSSFVGKRLLIHYEQGFGDNIQFVRYLPMVKQRGGSVIFEVRKPLYDLFEQIEGVDEFVLANPDGKPPEVDFDIHISPLDLPGLFETTLENIPSATPYIYAAPEKTKLWRNKVDTDSFKVAVNWSGSKLHGNDHNRSSSLSNFLALTKIEGVKFYSLQKDRAGEEIKQLAADMTIVDLGKDFEDFSDTAAAIENMDLVISVDTSVLHLAGAMGKLVWGLIAYEPEWRWMLDREDSPWYATMRLFRQKNRGDWDQLFAAVAEQLQLLVGNRG